MIHQRLLNTNNKSFKDKLKKSLIEVVRYKNGGKVILEINLLKALLNILF